MDYRNLSLRILISLNLLGAGSCKESSGTASDVVLTGDAALGDWTTDAPGVKRRIIASDLPQPAVDPTIKNFPKTVPPPAGALPRAPAGFSVRAFASGLAKPRSLHVTPGGDLFVVESEAGRVLVLRDTDGDGSADSRSTYVEGLTRPFGISLYPTGTDAPTHLYIANTNGVIRFPYKPGDRAPSGPAQTLITNLPSGQESAGGGGHWTRGLAFSRDNQRMFISVGSKENVSDDAAESRRANILAFTPEGTNEVIYASGIRNPVGLAIEPGTGALWTAVNERDELGDNLVPDYVTRVQEGGFYGWPWYYIGQNQDPRFPDKQPSLRARSLVPDVLVQSHSATLGLCFYTGKQFPSEYQGHLFVASHGSWNRSKRTGYKVLRIPMVSGAAVGYYEDFLVGFVSSDSEVWGRPVDVAVAADGALLVSDDASGTIWRVAYGG
jgi:glucose/arabinose dehydrogenase